VNGRPEPKVLLYKLSVRKSASGREYLSGWTGSAKLLGFKDAEPGKYGEEVWSVYAVTPPPRGDQVAGDRAVGPRPEFLHTDGARAPARGGSR
jgi:hypothetical protein